MPASAQHASGGVSERDGKRMRKQQLHSIHTNTHNNENNEKTGSRAWLYHMSKKGNNVPVCVCATLPRPFDMCTHVTVHVIFFAGRPDP